MAIKQSLKLKLAVFFAALGWMSQLHAQNWTLTEASIISFDIKTVGLSAVKGVSNQPDSRLFFDINLPENSSVQLVLPTSTLKFSNDALRPMILGENFFDAAQFKNVTFKSTEFRQQAAGHYWVAGELTLRGITKPITFDVVLKPNAANTKLLDIVASGSINRSDFGMKRSYADVGDKVNIQLIGQWQPK